MEVLLCLPARLDRELQAIAATEFKTVEEVAAEMLLFAAESADTELEDEL